MSKIADTEANATSLDGLVNDNALVPTLRNGPKPSYQYLVNGWTSEFDLAIEQYKESRGFNTKGTFADGFTYELPNDVGLDASGNPWILIDTSSLPVIVSAGTTPTNPPHKQVVFGTAAQVSTNTSDTVQSFIDSFALKIFQSPTSGGLTEIQTRTVDANEVYEVSKTSDDSLATIYSDASGTTEIVQNGTDNKSGSDGVVEFFVEDTFDELKIEVGASSAKFKNNIFIQRHTRVTLVFNTMNGLLNNKESFKIGKNVETSSFGNIFDSGSGKFRFTGVVNLEQSGNIDIIGGYVYDSIGQQFKVTPTNGRVTSASMGLIPDGVTDYHADGRMDKWLRYLSATDVTGVFIAGIYNTTMDNYYSNVSIHGEKGAIFTSGFHVAVNRNLNNPTLDRNKNTTWTGECASYERVGTWNCDNTYIERIIIREDAAKSKSGLRGAGVHLFGGTEDMTVGSIYVENSERSAALAVDWEPGQTPPKNVHLGNVVVKSSYVHGVSLVGENVTWDTMVIEEYGMGELTDPNINFALSQNPGGLVQAMGFSLGSFGSYSGNSVIVKQNPSSSQGIGSAVNLFTNGTFKCGLVKVNGSLGIGFQNNFTDATINKLVVENSATQGVFNKAKISGSSLVVSGSGTRGIRNEQGGLLAFNEVRTSGNGEEGYDSSAGIAAINRLQCLNNNQSTGGFGCVIGSQSRGNISALEIEQPSSGIGGGVDFNGVLNKFAVGNIMAKNASSSAGTGFASISLKANGLTHYGGGELSGDNGASSFQPLRIVGALNSSLNGLNITNTFNGNGVAGIITAGNNVGFMNCVNAAGTNLSSVTVSEFNCVGMSV